MNLDSEKQPFSEFIDLLKRRGFIIGVDHYLKLERVLDRFGSSCTPSELKYVLCPIFAVNAAQQAQFYQLFDLWFNQAGLDETEPETVRDKEPARPEALESIRKWPYVPAAVLGVMLICLAAGLILGPEQRKPVSDVVEVSGTGGNVATFDGKQVERLPNIRVPVLPLPEQPQLSFYQAYWKSLRLGAAAAPFIILLFIERFYSRRRRAAVKRQKGKKPPFVWPVRITAPVERFLTNRRFYTAAGFLRRRLEGDLLQPDIPKTISDTIENSGFPALCYRPVTRPPEYLFLIDLPEHGDHYARFMESLADMLDREGVFSERFFFTRDPQVCFREAGGERMDLETLASKYVNHRLVLAGDGECLLDPVTGEPESWTDLFHAWPDRAVLTPNPPKAWGMKEVMLAREFIVLPGSLEGLEALAGHFEMPSKTDLKSWVRSDESDAGTAPESEENIAALETRLGRDTFQWVCACAVYPELNWRLTLFLSTFQDRPVEEEDLLKLIRLPWFRKGAMPDALRIALIQRLDAKKLQAIRAALCRVLEDHPPPAGSGAEDAYRLNLAVHRWMISRKQRRHLKEIKAQMERAGEGRIIRDYTLLCLLDAGPSARMAFMLPKRLHRFFFKNGISLFGLKTGIRAMPAVAAAVILFWFFPGPPMAETTGGVHGKKAVFEFAHIPAGEFMMGSPENEPGRDSDETLHRVKLTRDFYMQTTEVTQGQWKAVMGENPSYFKDCGDDCPVENVSWEDAKTFIERLNKSGDRTYRLPTEAEWEYAARAGSSTAYFWGNDADCSKMMYENDVGSLENKCVEFVKNKGLAPDSTAPVKSYDSNAWGLYDMNGNVWEWCEDWYGDYPAGFVADPVGSENGARRVLRGGSWFSHAGYCRSAIRSRFTPGDRDDYQGFRLVLSPPGQQAGQDK